MKSRLTNITVLAVTVVVLFVSFEVYLRAAHKKELANIESRHRGRSNYTMASPNPKLVYTIRPNKEGSNSQGYMDAEYPFVKEEGVYRIVVIGDSVAEGWGVNTGWSFCKVLERTLNGNLPAGRYEVIVLARLGYSTSQEIVLLENEAAQYDPDMVLWSYCLNDPAHPLYHTANGELGRYFYRPSSHVVHFLWKRFFHIRQSIKARNCIDEYHAMLHCVYWDNVESDVRRIGRWVTTKDIPMIFLIHPIFQQIETFDAYTLTGVHEKLAVVAREAGLEPLDLLEAFKTYRPVEIKQHPIGSYDPWHPNAVGHRIMAGFIFDYLVENAYVRANEAR